MPLEMMRVIFAPLLQVNWFLGFLLSHKPFQLDRCPGSGYLMGISRWLPMDGFEALESAVQARKQMYSYLLLVHGLHKTGSLQVTSSHPIWGLRSSLGASSLPRSCIFDKVETPPQSRHSGGSTRWVSWPGQKRLVSLVPAILFLPPYSSFWFFG